MIRFAACLAVCAALGLLAAHEAGAHYRPGTHNARHAVNLAWCGRSSSYCAVSQTAWAVVRCETGGTFSPYARNGQYLGLFQLGYYARSTYGFGWDPWSQAFAARRMFRAEGWRPWTCATILGIR